MGYPQRIAQTLFSAVTPVAVTSSTNATPVVVTATAHGFKTGQRVGIFNHSTNTNANGIFVVGAVTTNTFAIPDEITGANIVGNGVGSGGVAFLAPPVMNVEYFKTLELQVGTSGSATVTLFVIGSMGAVGGGTTPRYDYPNMGGTITPSNPWQTLQIIDLGTNTPINGATGIVVAGTDIEKQYEVNINNTKYLTVIVDTWSQGAITVKGSAMTPA
jgi:hypothetical protein